MAEFLRGLIVSSASGAVIAILLFLAKPFIKSRISQRSQYFSWYLVFIRMLLPFTIGGFFVVNLIPSTQNQAVQTPASSISQGILSAASSAVASSAGITSIPQSAGFSQAAHSGFVFVDNWYPFILAFWLLGMLAMLGVNIAGYIGFAWRIKAARIDVENEEALALLKACSEKYNLARTLPLYLSSCCDTPMLCGLFRCSIVIPDRNFTPDQLRHAFMHELAHYRRYDNLLKWVTVLAVSVNWFNPVVYFAAREVGRQCELSCDETVTAGFSREERISYGRTLLAVASRTDHKPFALSATMSEDKRNLKERLEILIKEKKINKRTFLFSVSALLVVTILMVLTLVICGANKANSKSFAKSESFIEIDMLTIHNGFALTKDFHVIKTSNGGGNWKDLLTLGSLSGYSSEPTLFVLNDKTVYTASYTATGIEIEKSNDSGESWSKSEIKMQNDVQSGYGGSLSLSFLNQSNGFLLTSGSPTAGMMSKALYRTSDGGESWTYWGRSDHPAQEDGDMTGINGYTTGMAFSDAGIGMITCTYHGQSEISIYESTDNGKRWSVPSVPLPSKYASLAYGNAYYIDAYPPAFFGNNNKDAKIELYFCHDEERYAYIYSSNDGGATWRIDGISNVMLKKYCFVDDKNGFGLDENGALLITNDGGITWSGIS